MARNVSLETCPFCLTSPAQTQKGFVSHVGRHQQEISLAALPNLERNSDQEDSDDDIDHNENDDDDAEDEHDGNGSGRNSSGESSATNGTEKLRPTEYNANEPTTGSGNGRGASRDQSGDETPEEMSGVGHTEKVRAPCSFSQVADVSFIDQRHPIVSLTISAPRSSI